MRIFSSSIISKDLFLPKNVILYIGFINPGTV
ncbi:hypothetical protein LCGC14_2829450, partial [marine sediment metagenome]